MSNEKDGGPAFPSSSEARYGLGLSKLEWFAGMALQGWLANANAKPHNGQEYMARIFFDMAEAMLKESEKRNKT